MIPLEHIRDLYAFNDWANARVATTVTSIPAEEFLRHRGGSHPSIRDTWAHIIGAEWIWLERWLGRNPSAPPPWLNEPKAESLTWQLRDVAARRSDYLAQLPAADLVRHTSFHYLSGTPASHILSDLLIHAVNHSTFHRGQLVSMLREAGSPAMPTDFLVYRSETS